MLKRNINGPFSGLSWENNSVIAREYVIHLDPLSPIKGHQQ